MSMVSGFKDARRLLTTRPAELNSLSEGTDVAQMQRYFFANVASSGNLC